MTPDIHRFLIGTKKSASFDRASESKFRVRVSFPMEPAKVSAKSGSTRG
jgi:hypothetical protein